MGGEGVVDARAWVGVNRGHWDDRAEIHARSRYYDLEGVVDRGPAPIAGPDEDEVGPVAGRTLLHLHCHIGTDSLRWAALGADVTGVDLSPRSVEIAGDLAARTGLAERARFVAADVDDLPAALGPGPTEFDVVYASRGVLCWVPDIGRWAEIAAACVRPGGVFYLSEGHPFDVAFDPGRFGRTGYLDRGPRRYEDRRSYTELDDPIARPANHRWHHTLGDVVSAVAAAGLRVDLLHEHPPLTRPDDAETGVVERRRAVPPGAPGLFSLRARRG